MTTRRPGEPFPKGVQLLCDDDILDAAAAPYPDSENEPRRLTACSTVIPHGMVIV
jgi:hypothetical protein